MGGGEPEVISEHAHLWGEQCKIEWRGREREGETADVAACTIFFLCLALSLSLSTDPVRPPAIGWMGTDIMRCGEQGRGGSRGERAGGADRESERGCGAGESQSGGWGGEGRLEVPRLSCAHAGPGLASVQNG